MASDGAVRFTRQGGIWTATLENPEAGNAITRTMLEQLAEGLLEAARTPDCAVLVLQGAGEQFSLGRMRGAGHERLTPVGIRTELEVITRANALLVEAPCVTIAAVRGQALGAACGLVARCDLAVAAADARFGFPEIKAGIPPTIVMSYVAKALPTKQAFELIITGRELSAVEAQALGLVNRVVPTEQVLQEAIVLAQAIAAGDPLVVRTCKQFFREAQEISYAAAARYGVNLLATIQADQQARQQ
ncbi:MAG TPA: enoyl-CoA hydratase/isomerase family protein [Chloroflexota bacterium]|nr:enoyl-CoA hydratase/isomerase family protein [Chloroflexota bacterium]